MKLLKLFILVGEHIGYVMSKHFSLKKVKDNVMNIECIFSLRELLLIAVDHASQQEGSLHICEYFHWGSNNTVANCNTSCKRRSKFLAVLLILPF